MSLESVERMLEWGKGRWQEVKGMFTVFRVAH